MADVRKWLETLGLGQHADAFEENEVDWDLLGRLDHELLKEIGVNAVGQRLRILEAIEDLEDLKAEPHGVDKERVDPTSSEVSAIGEAERRQLTVMFCDLVGSVELGSRMDVEDYRDLLTRFRDAVLGVVERFDGFIARHQGDGLLVYFGYPQASEDDAERAVRAALEVARAVVALEHPYEADLKVRTGIATGLAVLGDVLSTGTPGHTEVAALGPTPNLAARLQGEAPENAVLISEVTCRLVSGFFEVQALEPRQLKGIPGKTAIFRVKAARTGSSRFAARAQMQLSPFTGREEELEILERRWQMVDQGRGQSVLIVGEPGIGKSRLLAEFRSTLAARPHELLLLQCTPYLANTPLHPIVQALDEMLELAGGLDDEAKLARLKKWLVERELSLDESVGLLTELLSISTEGRYPEMAAMDPQLRREKLLAWLVRFIRSTRPVPVMCVFEDLHWADPSTRELLEQLVEAIDHARVFLVGTARPDFDAPWSDRSNVRFIKLSRLGPQESERLAVSACAGDEAWPAELLENIVSRAGGNPLYLEELTRAVMQSGSIDEAQQAIPATLQDSLMARLDAVPFGKPIAQWGSVIGREFGQEILREAWDGTHEAFTKGIEELEHSGLIHRREGPHRTYRFKHALVRDAAYDSMLRSLRRHLHDQVLTALETHHPETAPEVLAHHATEANALAQALDYWEEAGRRAAARSANQEAIGHYRRGISLIEATGVERPASELALWSALGPLLMVAEGDASTSAEMAFGKALAAAERLHSDAAVQYPLAWGLWYMHMQRGDRSEVERLADRLGQMSRESGRSDLLIETYHSVWTFNLHYGELDAVRASTDAALALYDPVEHRDLRFQFANHDPRMCAFFHSAMAETISGYLRRGDEAIAEALRWALSIDHLPTIAIARLIPLVVSFWKDDAQGVQAASQAFMDACDDVGADWYRAVGVIFDGWAEALCTSDAAAHRRVAQALETVRATGQVTRMPMYHTVLAEALRANGHMEDALAAAEQAIRSCQDTGQVIYEPQAWNTFGVIRRSLADDAVGTDMAELAQPFTLGLAAAQAIGAPLLALHPAISLAELYRDRGQAETARGLLGPILDQLDGGSGVPVISRARKLMAKLT